MKARDNPFATHRVLQARYRLQNGSWDELLEKLGKLDYCAAIVGPEGVGKTTLLEDLSPLLKHRGFAIINLRLDLEKRDFTRDEWNNLWRNASTQDIILFDGAEQLPRWKWELFKRKSRVVGGLVITSHRNNMLPTLLNCTTSPRLLHELVEEIAPSEAPKLEEKTAALFHKHDGNLRHALRELYDIYADGAGVDGASVDDV